MRSRLRRDVIVALKARDDVAVVALRSAIAAIDNAEAVEVRGAPRRAGGELGRDNVAERLRREAKLLRAYLPEPDRDG